MRYLEFLSTPSARRATTRLVPEKKGRCNFYPRPPRGGRPEEIKQKAFPEVFLSTPSARRATKNREPERDRLEISIHALREEGDYTAIAIERKTFNISIHALREEGDSSPIYILYIKQISIHALREEGDGFSLRCSKRPNKFLSTPSARRATRAPRYLR